MNKLTDPKSPLFNTSFAKQLRSDDNAVRVKAVTDIMQGAYSEGRARHKLWAKVAEEPDEYSGQPPELLMKKIKQLEDRMYRHARDLEFEEAARLRDEIRRIQTTGLGLPVEKAG